VRPQMPVIWLKVHLHGHRNLAFISESSKYAINLHGRRSLRQDSSVYSGLDEMSLPAFSQGCAVCSPGT
jgi:hypothetical protein